MASLGRKTPVAGLFLSVVIIFDCIGIADGIPVTTDKKQVFGEHTRILLNAKQTNEVETRRHISLRPDQKAMLEKIAGGPLGHITVYSSRYNLCTCFDHTVAAIWTQRGVLDFPHSSLITMAKEKQLEMESREKEEKKTSITIRELVIVFDANGNMHIKGRRVDGAALNRRIDDMVRERGQQKSRASNSLLIFDPPPPISAETDSKALRQYREAKAHCDELGIETQDWGFDSFADR